MITDDYIRDRLTQTKTYCLVILKSGPARDHPDAQKLTWEHVRKNFELRAAGKLALVGRVMDASDTRGMGVFTTDLAETKQIMDADPAVQAGLFTYELHPWMSFPGDGLPK